MKVDVFDVFESSVVDDGVEVPQSRRWIVVGRDEGGDFTEHFQQNLRPSDDEILARRPTQKVRRLRPPALEDRIDSVVELCLARQTLLAAAADMVAFTAQERTRLTTMASRVDQRIKDAV